MQAVNRYLIAVQKGDSAALERLIPAADARRDALIRRHDGHPATVASMTLDSTPSDAYWTLTVTYDAYADRLPVEHLLVEPDPSEPPDNNRRPWVIASVGPGGTA